MISWQAYAPRRARDPEAWLRGKGITSREGLNSALVELGIDPSTFPQVLADSYLRDLEKGEVSPPGETRSSPALEDSAAPSSLQATQPKPQKRFNKAPPS